MQTGNYKYIAFANNQSIATGELADVACIAKQYLLTNKLANVIIFEYKNSQQIDIDYRGSPEEVRTRIIANSKITRGRGRPKLGVVSKEITLLPRHWDWLANQGSSASATLRRLVDAARKADSDNNLRKIQANIHSFMTIMAGDFINYEEALRALYANDLEKLKALIANWPKDIQEYILIKLKA